MNLETSKYEATVTQQSVMFISQSAILFTGQETIPARNAVCVPVKEVVVYDELLLPVLSTVHFLTTCSWRCWIFSVCTCMSLVPIAVQYFPL